MRSCILLILLLAGTGMRGYCQISLPNALRATGLPKAAADGLKSVNKKALASLQKKYEKMDASLDKQSQKMLARLQRKEDKLRKKVAAKDSLTAARLFGGTKEEYATLKSKLSQPYDSLKQFPLKEYIPGVDSMQTALNFLKGQGMNLPPEKAEAIGKAGNELKGLQDRLQKASDIESFVKQREQQLKEQLRNSGFARQLKGINKEAFYYSQRLREYKEMLKSPEKMEEKLLSAVRESKAFQSFMQRHSYLSKLFPSPPALSTGGEGAAALAGLQTRAAVQGMLRERFPSPPALSTGGEGAAAAGGNAGGDGMNSYVQGQVRAAQGQLNALKEKMGKLGLNGGSGDMTMPDFVPNNQHTKRFWKRIEYGVNVQSEGARSVIPATSEVAGMLGYKLSDKSVIGVGMSYRVGWGHEGFKNVTITNEGVGLRSYIDIKAKGNFWLSGGYEMNYQQSFVKYQQLYKIDLWQRSGLVGITKKYKVGRKENNMQVLWDFLSYGQVPRTQAIKFRVGFGL